MIAVLDHDDFQKSRKALLLSAMLLIFLHHLKLSSDAIEMGGLRFELNSDRIKSFATVFTVYFLTVFAIKSLEYALNLSLDFLKEQISKMDVEISKYKEEHRTLKSLGEVKIPNSIIEDYERRIHGIDQANLKILIARMFNVYAIEIILPLTVAIYGLVRYGTFRGLLSD